jgi:DNA-binding response OmpR family regulator
MNHLKMLLEDDDGVEVTAVSGAIRHAWHDCDVLAAPVGETGLRAFYEADPDVVLLDVSKPAPMAGLELLSAIRRVSDVPVILVSESDTETDQVRGLELGADDYVCKPFGHLALLARVRAVLRRAELPPPARAVPDFEAGELAIHFDRQEVTVGGAPVRLTPLEYKLLYHLARNPGRLLPHRLLLDRVWGEEAYPNPDYVKVFVSRLRAKLERPGGPRYIATERGAGYRFVKPARPAPSALRHVVSASAAGA